MQGKLKLGSGKKGYMQIDFIFATVTFFLFLTFAYTHFTDQMKVYDENIQIREMSSTSRDICALVSKTSGYPSNWSANVTEGFHFIGFKSVQNKSLESEKLTALNTSHYRYLLDTMNADFFVRFSIVGLTTGTQYLGYGFPAEEGSISSRYTCYSNYNNEHVKIIVEAWR